MDDTLTRRTHAMAKAYARRRRQRSRNISKVMTEKCACARVMILPSLFCMACMSYYTIIFFPSLFGLPAIPRHEKPRTTKTREKDTETETGEPFFFSFLIFGRGPRRPGLARRSLNQDDRRRPPPPPLRYYYVLPTKGIKGVAGHTLRQKRPPL